MRAARHLTTYVIRPLVILLVAVALVRAGDGGYQAARQGVALLWSHPASKEELQLEAVRSQLGAQVARGGAVFLARAPGMQVWHQRLAEVAIMCGITVVEDPSKAQTEVSIVEAPEAAGGLRLVVRPR